MLNLNSILHFFLFLFFIRHENNYCLLELGLENKGYFINTQGYLKHIKYYQ